MKIYIYIIHRYLYIYIYISMNIYIHMYIIAGSTEAGLPVVFAVKLPATSRSSGSWLLNFEVAETRRYTCGLECVYMYIVHRSTLRPRAF